MFTPVHTALRVPKQRVLVSRLPSPLGLLRGQIGQNSSQRLVRELWGGGRIGNCRMNGPEPGAFTVIRGHQGAAVVRSLSAKVLWRNGPCRREGVQFLTPQIANSHCELTLVWNCL